MKNNNLKKEVELLRVHKNMNRRGSLKIIAEAISVNHNSLCMAITGYRDGPGAIQMLEQTKEYLESLGPAP